MLARRCTAMAMRCSFAARNTRRSGSTCVGSPSCTSELAKWSLMPWRSFGSRAHRASSSSALKLQKARSCSGYCAAWRRSSHFRRGPWHTPHRRSGPGCYRCRDGQHERAANAGRIEERHQIGRRDGSQLNGLCSEHRFDGGAEEVLVVIGDGSALSSGRPCRQRMAAKNVRTCRFIGTSTSL